MLKYSYKAQGSNSTLRTPNGHLKRQHGNCSKSFIPSKIRKLLLLHTTNMLNYLYTLQEPQRNTPTPDESSQRQNATISSAQGSNSTLTLKEAYPQVLTLFLSSNKSTQIIIHINKVTETRVSTFEIIHFIYIPNLEITSFTSNSIKPSYFFQLLYHNNTLKNIRTQ